MPADDALEEELSRALHARASAPVDVDGLIEGSHRRARHLRTRRVVLGTASVVLVVALPVSADLLHDRDGSGAAASLSSQPPVPIGTVSGQPVPDPDTGIGSPASVTASAPPVRTSSSAGPTGEVGPPVAYEIPETFAFGAADLPGLTLMSDSDQVAGLPAVHGQTCRPAAPGDASAIAGREWSWADGNTTGGMTVTLSFTGWAQGQGARVFADLVANTGRCVFTTAQKNHSGELNSSVEGWMGTSAVDGLSYGRAVVRVGDILGGIEVTDARGNNAVIDDVQQLVQSVVEQLTAKPAPTAPPTASATAKG